MAKARPLFITFEGGEGAGKSTQIRILAERLQAAGRDPLITREPGGTPAGEALRQLLVTGETDAWSAEAEALLNYAARDSHLRQVIRPALAGGRVVICDRFMDSTRVYQGYAGGCDMALIDVLERTVVATDLPHLTLVLDLATEVGLSRAQTRGGSAEDRFERKGSAFHAAIRDGFRAVAEGEPRRCRLIAADASVEQVAARVWTEVEPFLDG